MLLPRARLSDDDGISLVEVMVSTVLLGVVLAAFGSTLMRAMLNVTTDEQMVRATQLAADELERFRSLEWDVLGFYADDPGYRADVGGDVVVTLGATRPADAAAPAPAYEIDRDGTTYAASLWVVWKDDVAVPSSTQDHKELRIRLDWSVRDRAFHTEAATTRIPTLDEVPRSGGASCDPGTIQDFQVTPAVVVVDSSGRLDQQVTVTVDICPPASTVSVVRPTGATIPVMQVSDQRWQHRYLPGAPGFGPEDEVWTASVVSVEGTDVAESEVMFISEEGDDLQVVGLEVAPAFCVSSNRKLTAPVTLTAGVAGTPSHVEIRWTERNGAQSAHAQLGADGLWRVEVTDGRFETTTTISVIATRTTDTIEADETFIIDVLRSGSSC